MRFAAIASLLLIAMPLPAAPPTTHTIVNDAAALRRLQRNSGITLQWISFETAGRGHLHVKTRNGVVHLKGEQHEGNGGGQVTLDGDVVQIDARSFTFRGRIEISDTPDKGRSCIRDGEYEFRVTGKRRYWRLQQMQTCDNLTDYVDIYY
ncbi:hypothetical protein ACSBM8_05465 [Sphingomonas sp. ASY06-1R]|jgi:ribosomal protein L39E|uniref:hypothetical protein n=1 Tax=Sphingomonas sp. ASY06-1R TaxID=3445771 RepID=UPI003FA30FD2